MNETIEQKLVKKLIAKNYKISFGESCTGGLLVATLINASGASKVVDESYVTYANTAKQKILKVKKRTIAKYSVYSKEVACEMVEGLFKKTKANVCVSVTGEAENQLNDCTCYYAIIINKQKWVEQVSFKGSRNEVRDLQTKHILTRIYELLQQY